MVTIESSVTYMPILHRTEDAAGIPFHGRHLHQRTARVRILNQMTLLDWRRVLNPSAEVGNGEKQWCGSSGDDYLDQWVENFL